MIVNLWSYLDSKNDPTNRESMTFKSSEDNSDMFGWKIEISQHRLVHFSNFSFPFLRSERFQRSNVLWHPQKPIYYQQECHHSESLYVSSLLTFSLKLTAATSCRADIYAFVWLLMMSSPTQVSCQKYQKRIKTSSLEWLRQSNK